MIIRELEEVKRELRESKQAKEHTEKRVEMEYYYSIQYFSNRQMFYIKLYTLD